MLRFAYAILLIAAAEVAADAQEWRADSISWQTMGANGTRYALLEGVRDKAGVPFSYAFSIPAGVWDGPHHHSAAARVFVAKGTLKLGYGDRLDKESAKSFPAGSYVLVPAGAVHFDGADEDTVIFGTAIGPWATTYIDGGSPASAGSPAPIDRR